MMKRQAMQPHKQKLWKPSQCKIKYLGKCGFGTQTFPHGQLLYVDLPPEQGPAVILLTNEPRFKLLSKIVGACNIFSFSGTPPSFKRMEFPVSTDRVTFVLCKVDMTVVSDELSTQQPQHSHAAALSTCQDETPSTEHTVKKTVNHVGTLNNI